MPRLRRLPVLNAVLIAATLAFGLLGGSLAPVQAASFQLSTYSVRDMGMANAGSAALAEDASTIYSNPAGLAKLDSAEATIGAIGLIFHSKAEDRGSRNLLGTPTGGNADAFARDALVPDAYIAVPLTSRVTIGLGITAPFGLDIEYEGNWGGRYQAIGSKILAVDINPSIGVKLTDWASVGAGFSAQYLHAAISNTVDFGAVCLGAAGLGTCAGAGLLPGQADGHARIRGTDWAFGWNLGLLFDLDDKTKLGLSYRARVRHELEGDADFTVPANAALLVPLSGGAFTDTAATAPLTMPDTFTASLTHKLTDRLSLAGTLQWVGWSSLQALIVHYDNPAQPAQVETLRYRDVLRGALGMSYAVDDRLTLRGGLAYEESPVREELRTARIPDTDRYIAAVGASYRISERVSIDAAYQYMKFKSFSMNQVGATADTLGAVYTADCHHIGLGARFTF